MQKNLDNANAQSKNGKEKFSASRYFLLCILLSFIGWVWEVGVMFVQTGKFFNQGFLTLPICPIYGTTLLIVYFLLGTPQNPKGILKGVHKKMAAQFLYFSFVC